MSHSPQLSGAAYVISKHVGNSYLWDRVRVVGGAYGGFCDFNSHSGMFTFLSYRDPNLAATLDVYDGAGDWLRKLEVRRKSGWELAGEVVRRHPSRGRAQ